VIADGAIQEYDRAFQKWAEVMEKYPRLKQGPLVEDLIDSMREYYVMLRIAGIEWPLDFPLQYIIERRAKEDLRDGLPTVEELADRLERAKSADDGNEE
jgi:hypothetical protein